MASYKNMVISGTEYPDTRPFVLGVGDTAENMKVLGGGVIEVAEGGKITSATVSNDGPIEGATSNTRGRLIVDNGGTANVVNVDEGLGTAKYDEETGKTYVETMISSGVYLSTIVGVEAGGYVTSVTVEDGVVRAVSGAVLSKVTITPKTSTGTVIVKTADAGLIVEKDATAEDVLVDRFGMLRVTDGGTVVMHTLTDEEKEEGLYGNINVGGVLYVTQGGKVSNLELSFVEGKMEQELHITVGTGTDVSGIIEDSDLGEERTLSYKSSLSGVTLDDSNVYITVGKGGTGTKVYDFSTLAVENGGKVSYTYVGGATEESSGRGVLSIFSDGSASNTYLNRGSMYVELGGTASTITMGNYTETEESGDITYYATLLSVNGGTVSNVTNLTAGTTAHFGTVGTVEITSGTISKLKMNGYSILNATGGTVSDVTVTGGYTKDEVESAKYLGISYYTVSAMQGTKSTESVYLNTMSLKADKDKYLYAYLGNGAVANKVTINDRGTVIADGTAELTSTTVNAGGSLTLTNGATTYYDKIAKGGVIVVSSGGIVNDTTVAAGGSLDVVSSGGAERVTVQKGGSMTVEEGANISGTTISNGGYMNVTFAKETSWTGTYNKENFNYKTSAKTSGTTTTYEATGFAANSYMNGTVAGSGVILHNAMVAKGGYLQAANRGTIDNVAVSSGGTLKVGAGASATGARIYKNGKIDLDLARNTVEIYDPTTGEETEVVETTSFAGTSNYVRVNYGVNIDQVTVNSNTKIAIGNDGSASNLSVEKGGYVIIKENGSLNTAKIDKGGSIYAAANSYVTGPIQVNGTLTLDACTYCFDLSTYSPAGSGYLVNYNNVVASSVSYEVKVATNQMDGKYILMTNANDFTNKIHLSYTTSLNLVDEYDPEHPDQLQALDITLSVGESATDARGVYTYSLVRDSKAKTVSLVVEYNRDAEYASIQIVNPTEHQYNELSIWKQGTGYGYGSIVKHGEYYYQNQTSDKKILTAEPGTTDWTRISGFAKGTKVVYNGVYYEATANTSLMPDVGDKWKEVSIPDDYLIVSNDKSATSNTIMKVGDSMYLAWNLQNNGTCDMGSMPVQVTVTNRQTGSTYTAYTLNGKYNESMYQDANGDWYILYEQESGTTSLKVGESFSSNPVYKVGTLSYQLVSEVEKLVDTQLVMDKGGYYDIVMVANNGACYTKSVYVVDEDTEKYFNSDYDTRRDTQGTGYARADKDDLVKGYAGGNAKMTFLTGELDSGIYSFDNMTFDSDFTGTVVVLDENLKKVATASVKNGVVTLAGAVLEAGNYALQIQGKNASSYEFSFALGQDLSTTKTNYSSWVEAKHYSGNGGKLIGTEKWVKGTWYTPGEIVYHNGTIWRVAQAGTDSEPSDTGTEWTPIAKDAAEYAVNVLSTDLTVGDTVACIKLDVFNELTYDPSYLYTFKVENVGGDDKLKVTLFSVTTNSKGVTTTKTIKSATFTSDGTLTPDGVAFTDTTAEYYISVESLNASQGVKSNVTVNSYVETAPVYAVNKIFGVSGLTTDGVNATATPDAKNDDDVMQTAQEYVLGNVRGYTSDPGKTNAKFNIVAEFSDKQAEGVAGYDYKAGDLCIYNDEVYKCNASYPSDKPSTSSRNWTKVATAETTSMASYAVTDWNGYTDTVDWYKFTVDNAGTYAIGAAGDTKNVKITVYSAYYDGKDYTYSYAGDASAVKSLGTKSKGETLSLDLLTGEYYVKVESLNAKSTTQNTKYTLNFAMVDAYTQLFTSTSEESLFAERNTSYSFTLDNYYDVTFTSTTGVTLYQNDGKNGKTKISVTAGTAITLAAGDYFIDITSKSGNIVVNKTTSKYARGTFSDNNTWLNAKDITGQTVSNTGWVGYGNTASYYKIVVDEHNSGSYTFTLNKSGSKYDYTNNNLKMTLYRETVDKNGVTSLTAIKTITAGKAEVISVGSLLDGNYYVELASVSGTTAANAKTSYYSFTMGYDAYATLASYDAWESEKPASTTHLDSGDYAAFTLTEKSYVTFNDGNYQLYKNNGSNSLSSITISNASAVLEAGTYYVKATAEQTEGSVAVKAVSKYDTYTPEKSSDFFGTVVEGTMNLTPLKDWIGLNDTSYEYVFTTDVIESGKPKSYGWTELSVSFTDALYASKSNMTFSVSMLNSSGKWVTLDSVSGGTSLEGATLEFNMDYNATYKISLSVSDKGAGNANGAFTITGTTNQLMRSGDEVVDMSASSYTGSMSKGDWGKFTVVNITGFMTYAKFSNTNTKNYTLYRSSANGLEKVNIPNGYTSLDEGVYYVNTNASLSDFNVVLNDSILNPEPGDITFGKAENNVSQMNDVTNWVGATESEDGFLFNTMDNGTASAGYVTFEISSMTNTTSSSTGLNLILYKNDNGNWKQVATGSFSTKGDTTEENPVTGKALSANLEDGLEYKLVVQTSDKGAGGDNVSYKLSGSIDWFDLDNNSLLSPTFLKYQSSALVSENLYQWDAAVSKSGDLCDCYDVNQLSNITVDLTSGSVKITFYDENFDSVKFSVDGSAKEVTSLTLTDGKEESMAVSDLLSSQDSIRYMKVEAVGSTNNHYYITSTKPN